ncbi:chromatin assembly factor 1 subunit [Grosmannia clavigera kw1407]|uniref:Chromatin assembly factor 1 subunit n=1 Tax=Grosmannia clavigera (strain kw1407 / UAMH 11150) TaxID=655863 RepID=F0XT30_GROCL|nr:chromatin assembly factor 1 subunit [Grosmannia clavigera kw1407]EFW99313.1 chromatin assembly factor 1 subunit [Grosmannia clavigera kw1407]
MKSTPLIINWHDQNAPIYSAHFEPHGKNRLATAGGDNNVRLWKVESNGENRKVEYLSTLAKHTQAVNVVRWSPKGELLASGGDDGNVILWVPSESYHPTFGNDGYEDRETWRTKHMCRSSGAEIYDLAWSPDGSHFIIGSMDNIARIYNAASGVLVRQIAEHSHYVQGVAWDPLNEYIATQSSDRSVHVYSLKAKDGQYILTAGLDDKAPKLASHIKADLPPRRLASQSPVPPEPILPSSSNGHRTQLSVMDAVPPMGSPVPSAPGTPTSVALPMNPPSVVSHSRRSSFSSRRSVSPAPSTMPLPAVMPMEASPKLHMSSSNIGLGSSAVGMKNANLYANETLTSFFRRLTFTPDGSLLLTPAGQYQTQHHHEGSKPSYEIINTVYIYSRGGISKAPIAHLPGHKKPSVAVRCSPIIYTLRPSAASTKHITIDTSSAEEPIIPSLPDPISNPTSVPTSTASVMDPPPPPPPPPQSHASAADPATPNAKILGSAETVATAATPGPKSAFALSHRMIYAVATQDSILLYDTQQQTPLCVVSNLHCATFTDITWSSDGLTLLVSSSDGFCSTLSFTPGELGQQHMGETALVREWSRQAATGAFGDMTVHRNSASSFTAPSPPATASFASFGGSSNSSANGGNSNTAASTVTMRPSSPARSNSASSVLTQASLAALNNPPLVVGSMPSLAATAAGGTGKTSSALAAAVAAAATPPETPRNRASSVTSSVAGSVTAAATASSLSVPVTTGTKREAGAEGEKEDVSVVTGEPEPKKRRIAPTPVISGSDGGSSA